MLCYGMCQVSEWQLCWVNWTSESAHFVEGLVRQSVGGKRLAKTMGWNNVVATFTEGCSEGTFPMQLCRVVLQAPPPPGSRAGSKVAGP